LGTLNGLWSRFLNDSELSQLNNSPGQALNVSPETIRMLAEMAWGHSRTKGAFDPTVLPALLAEGYTSSLVTPGLDTHIPATSRAKGNLSAIDIRGSVVTLPAGTTLDSGGVGKGLAADMGVELALAGGALGALVEVGGDLRVEGISPRADRWRLAIENPYDRSQRLSIVELRHQGLATSTITKRRFEVEGRETHHIIDPRTLRSADSDTIQASVIAPTAAQAEMWTKVAFVDGSQQLLSFARHHGFHAGCLLQTGEWVTSAGWPGTNA
jgi:thiamine biosynthesis lipoprotein